MRHGQWKSSAVMRGYVEEGTIWTDNAATVNGTTVNLGHITSSALQFGAHDLKVQTNAANGYTVYLRYTGPMSDANGHNLVDFATGVHRTSRHSRHGRREPKPWATPPTTRR
jgi:hypothetical protein